VDHGDEIFDEIRDEHELEFENSLKVK